MITLAFILISVATFFGLFTSLVFLIALLQSKESKKNPPCERFPMVSIIVPVWNEKSRVIDTLESLKNLDWPIKKIEVLVINDGSTDDTLAYINRYRKYPQFKIFSKKNGGKAKAMNFGLARANGEFIMNLDADSSLDSWSLKSMIGYFDQNQKTMAVIPYMLIKNPHTLIHKIQYIEFLSATFMRRVFGILGGIFLAPGPGTLFRKEFFNKHGGIDEGTIVEDIELSLRINKYNYIIEHAHGVHSYTMGADNLKHFFSQRLRWFRGFMDMMIQYKCLFNYKYGNLGAFILPISVISVFINLTLFGYLIIKVILNFIQNLYQLSYINFDIKNWLDFNFDPYFIDTSAIAIFSLVLLFVAVMIMLTAKSEAGIKYKIKYSYVLFILSYWFLSSLAWVNAVYYKYKGKSIVWGGKTG